MTNQEPEIKKTPSDLLREVETLIGKMQERIDDLDNQCRRECCEYGATCIHQSAINELIEFKNKLEKILGL